MFMNEYVFVGWPLEEAQCEAVRRGIHVETIIETGTLKNRAVKGIPYIIQERWLDSSTVILVSALRLIGELEQMDGC